MPAKKKRIQRNHLLLVGTITLALIGVLALSAFTFSVQRRSKQNKFISPTPTTSAQYGVIQRQITPYLTPIDSTRNRFVYPDQSVSFEIPTNAKIDITEEIHNGRETKTFYLVGMELPDIVKSAIYSITFFNSGIGGDPREYSKSDVFLGGQYVTRKIYYTNGLPQNIFYWPLRSGGFGPNIVMIGAERSYSAGKGSFELTIDKFIDSMKVLKEVATPSPK